jgi:Holliday junction resolvase RusA-like endonuclease
MGLICAFTVLGEAKPQGSLTDYGRGVTYSNRASLMQWRADIRAALQQQLPQFLLPTAMLRGPVAVRVRFLFPKPASVSKRRLFPAVAPDCDKLLRAIGDALEHTVVQNDAQIVHWDAWKMYTHGRAEARIEVWQPDLVPLPLEVNPFDQPGLF